MVRARVRVGPPCAARVFSGAASFGSASKRHPVRVSARNSTPGTRRRRRIRHENCSPPSWPLSPGALGRPCYLSHSAQRDRLCLTSAAGRFGTRAQAGSGRRSSAAGRASGESSPRERASLGVIAEVSEAVCIESEHDERSRVLLSPLARPAAELRRPLPACARVPNRPQAARFERPCIASAASARCSRRLTSAAKAARRTPPRESHPRKRRTAPELEAPSATRALAAALRGAVRARAVGR